MGYVGFIESCGLLRSFAGGPFSCFCLRGLLLTVLKRVGWGNHPPGRLVEEVGFAQLLSVRELHPPLAWRLLGGSVVARCFFLGRGVGSLGCPLDPVLG